MSSSANRPPTAPALLAVLLLKVLPTIKRAVLAAEDVDGAAAGVGAERRGLVVGEDASR